MTEIAALGLRVDGVTDIDRASSSLDRLTSSSEKAEKSTDGLASASKKSSQDVSRLSDSSKQASSGVDSLATVAKRASGVIISAFAGIKLTSLIKDIALANSRFEQLGTVMEVVGRNVGLSSDQINKYAKEVQAMGISMTESRQTVIRMAQAQMDLSKASELARLAQDAAVIANTNSSEALGRLIYGLQSGQVEILRTMGLNVNFANSYTALAKEMGVTVAELSEADKAQARTNAVMEAGIQIAGAYEASMDSASKQLGSTTRYVQDLGVMLGGVFSDATKQTVFGYSDALKELHSTVTELSEDGSLERWSKNIASAINLATINVRLLTEVAIELGREAKKTADDVGMLASALRSAGIELPTMESVMRRVKEEMQDAALWAVFLAKSGLNAITGNLRGTISAWNELQETLKDRSAERQTKALNDLLITTTKRAESYGGALDDASDSLGGIADNGNDAKDAIKKLNDEFTRLENRLDPVRAKARSMQADLDLLHSAWDAGVIKTREEYERLRDIVFDSGVSISSTMRDEVLPAVEEVAAQADPLAESWQAAIERIDSAFVDLWKSAFEGFKDFADSLKNALIQLLAELAHRATTQKILVSFGLAGVSGGAMAGATGSAASSVASSAGGGLLSSILGPTGGVGTALRVIRDYGTAIAGIGGAIYGYQQSGWKGAIGGAAGGAGGAIAGSALGMAIAGPIGAAVGKALGGFLGGTLGGKIFGGQYETTRGGIQLGFDESGFSPLGYERQTKSGGLFGSTKRRFIFSDLDAELDAMLNDSYDSAVNGIRMMYETIGVAVGDGALEGVRIATLQIGTSGKSEQAQEEIEAQIAQWFSDLQEAMVSSIDSSMDFASLVDLSSSLTSVNAIFDTLGLALNEISISGAKSSQALIEAAGGLENLAASADYYYQNFYTEQERLEKSTAMVTAALAELGYELPETHDGFRRIVEAARDAGAGNEALLASLLNLAPAVDQVIRGNQALAESARQAAAAQSQAVAQLQSQSRALEIQLMRLQGMTAEADAAQYAIDTAGMSEAEKAIFDYNKSLEQQIETIKETQRIEREAIAQRERDLAKAAQERERMEAAESAARDRAAQQAAALQQRIASERYSLESRLLQLQGNTAALRERELAALHPVNQELQKQIWELEDMAAAQQEAARAADEAARAAEQVQREWRGVADTLLSEVDRIRRGLLTSSGMSFAAAQAQFSILTAQARSGDMEAARALPDASRTLLDLARTQASSYADFARIAAATASSMESTAFDLPNVDVASSVTQAGESVKNEIRELREENRLLRHAIEQIVINTGRSARIWDDVTQGGTSIRTVEADA